ncbi:hypothetical protein P4V86_04900 [Brevibacillus laterosporus]|uniref:hypothetical protein n=1 Tax=Brevibacillus laterosporus TaxID=1465 RepID=UPI000369CCA0|nr:hypothetical protein [Brevibacillus laterosporus]ATO51355.1 hypothetical protein BrL25_21005 [Brevibacillus laterosporus DSM 25]MBG9801174.1 hypothetical protein [Brevibacillus laterosporus]MED2002694.1 hypothetical protein [Brevibacillus laterosporus]MED4765055.1 hypothetical protein [Brevibacillus laterosporus]TPH12343.1 hypothetical protein EGH09_16735 [Brevibacillus laterosporus]
MEVRSVGLFTLILFGILQFFAASPSIEEPTVGTGAPPEYLSIQDLDNITFKDDSSKTKTIKIPIKSIPEFNRIYSELEDDNLKKMELFATRGIILSEDKDTTYLLLRYQCGTKLCNAVLIKKEHEKITTTPVIPESQIYVEHKFSPNKKILALSFISDLRNDYQEYTVYLIDTSTLKKRKTIPSIQQTPDLNKILRENS